MPYGGAEVGGTTANRSSFVNAISAWVRRALVLHQGGTSGTPRTYRGMFSAYTQVLSSLGLPEENHLVSSKITPGFCIDLQGQNLDAGGVARRTQHHYHLHLPPAPCLCPRPRAPSLFPLSQAYGRHCPQSSLWTPLQVPTLLKLLQPPSNPKSFGRSRCRRSAPRSWTRHHQANTPPSPSFPS